MDFKIAAKAIANRLESILPKLIHPDQTAGLREREIYRRKHQAYIRYNGIHQIAKDTRDIRILLNTNIPGMALYNEDARLFQLWFGHKKMG